MRTTGHSGSGQVRGCANRADRSDRSAQSPVPSREHSIFAWSASESNAQQSLKILKSTWTRLDVQVGPGFVHKAPDLAPDQRQLAATRCPSHGASVHTAESHRPPARSSDSVPWLATDRPRRLPRAAQLRPGVRVSAPPRAPLMTRMITGDPPQGTNLKVTSS